MSTQQPTERHPAPGRPATGTKDAKESKVTKEIKGAPSGKPKEEDAPHGASFLQRLGRALVLLFATCVGVAGGYGVAQWQGQQAVLRAQAELSASRAEQEELREEQVAELKAKDLQHEQALAALAEHQGLLEAARRVHAARAALDDGNFGIAQDLLRDASTRFSELAGDRPDASELVTELSRVTVTPAAGLDAQREMIAAFAHRAEALLPRIEAPRTPAAQTAQPSPRPARSRP